jgi:hypothetical protein
MAGIGYLTGMGKEKPASAAPASAPASAPTVAPTVAPPAPEPPRPSDRADTLLTILIFLVFLGACLLAYWLTQRQAVPGAPGAPIG